MASDTELVILAMLLLEDSEDEGDKEKRIWVRSWIQERNAKGCFHQLLPELAVEDTRAFQKFMRMDYAHFQTIVTLLSEKLLKKDTIMREAIKPAEMCSLTIRFLATGESFRSLEYQFRISRRAISYIVMEVCQALYEVMGPKYLAVPKSSQDWLEIAEKFEERWNFPNCLGAVDGKRILLQQPDNTGSHFHDYKGTGSQITEKHFLINERIVLTFLTHVNKMNKILILLGNNSIILMGVIGPEYEFLVADVGMNGRMSDGGNWARNEFRESLANPDNPLSIPDPRPLPSRGMDVPYVCVGDDAFPLTSYMMKPYASTGLTEEKRIFNYRLSRCRRISENAFGILANRWRVFRSCIQLPPAKATTITLGAITLHNFLRSNSKIGKIYVPPGLADKEDPFTGQVIPGAWRKSGNQSSWETIGPHGSRNATFHAKELRKEFTRYFSLEGAVPWQWTRAHID